jgi:hypothetical protein
MFVTQITKKRKLMTVLFIVLGAIFIVIGLVRGLSDIDPKYYVLMSSLVGLLISGFAISGKLVQDITSSEKQKKILDTTIATLEQSRKSLETATKNFEIAQKINDNVTGGESFAYLQTVKLNPSNSILNYGYMTEGENPVYLEDIEILGLEKLDNLRMDVKENFYKEYGKIIKKDKASTIIKGSIEPNKTLKLTKNKNIFRIFFFARNGNWRQDLIIVKVNNNWETASYVYKYTAQFDKALTKKISPNFPRAELIDWLETAFKEY